MKYQLYIEKNPVPTLSSQSPPAPHASCLPEQQWNQLSVLLLRFWWRYLLLRGQSNTIANNSYPFHHTLIGWCLRCFCSSQVSECVLYKWDEWYLRYPLFTYSHIARIIETVNLKLLNKFRSFFRIQFACDFTSTEGKIRHKVKTQRKWILTIQLI